MCNIALYGGVLVAVLLAGCSAVDSSAHAAVSSPAHVTRVRLIPVASGRVAHTLRVAGTVRRKSQIDLAFKVGGIVKRIAVDDGDHVRRGQVLAAIDPTEVRALHNQADAAAAKAERDLVRARTLLGSGALGTADLQNSETLAAVARADAEAASFNLRHTRLVAPEAGIIDRRNVEVGELVAPGQPVFRILGSSRGAVVRAELNDRDVLALDIGQPARVFLDARPRESLNAHVSQIATSASNGTGTLAIEAKLEDAPSRLPSGVTAKVELDTTLDASVSVPLSALADGDAVFVVDGDRVRRVPVHVDFLSGDRAALTDDLGSIQRVVELGAVPLTDGDRVQVVD